MGIGRIYHVALIVLDAAHENGIHTHAFVGECRIRTHHLAHRHVGRTQTKRILCVYISGYSEHTHHLHKIAGTVLVYEPCRNPVVGVGECPTQVHHLPYASASGISRCPVAEYRLRVAVSGARRVSLRHRKRIQERFDSRTHLTLAFRHHIILEMVEIRTAYVCLHISGNRVHAHHAYAQYAFHIHQRVIRSHRNGLGTGDILAVLLHVCENVHLVWRMEFLLDFSLGRAALLHKPVAFGLGYGIAYQLLHAIGA